MRGRERWRRRLGVGALLVALAAVALVVIQRDDSHSYTFQFLNAGQLVKGDLVRIGGTPVGEVTSIELSDDGQAEVRVSVEEEFAPLHAGTTATIRAGGLIGIANRYVDVHPGPNFRQSLGDGAVLSADNTTTIVELDELFNSLDPRTRGGLTQLVDGFSEWYRGREKEANRSGKIRGLILIVASLWMGRPSSPISIVTTAIEVPRYPRPLGYSRANAYAAPGWLDRLASGLSVYDTRGCANGDVAPPATADPPELQSLVAANVFRTPGRDVARPPCIGQGPYPGFGTSFPQLRAEP